MGKLLVGKHNAVLDSEFDPKELKRGIEVEHEHSDDSEICKAIAKDHLMEIKNYYTLLDEMEAKGKAINKEKTASISDRLLAIATNLDPRTKKMREEKMWKRPSVADQLDEIQKEKEKGNWIPANRGTEEPFLTRTKRRLQYMYQPSTGNHAYYDLGSDRILTPEEAEDALGLK